jgi:hypothetical protein
VCFLPGIAAGSASGWMGQGARSARVRGAGGALDASSREWIMGPGPGGELVWRVSSVESEGLLLVVGCAVVAVGVGEEGSQTYLGPRAWWPGDMMIDWVFLPPGGGMRPLSLCRPPGLPCVAGR